MSQFDSKEFKKLKAKWYKKLERSGFNDVETAKGQLKIPAKEVMRDYRLASKTSKEDYYALADRFLLEHKFKSKREKIIWEYHCNGLGAPAISEVLRKVRIKMDRTTVGAIIVDLTEQMKAKYLKVGK